MQKLRRRMGIAAILALPIALGASLLTNLKDFNSSVVSNDEMTLCHTDGVDNHEYDENAWIQLTAEYVDSTQDGKSEGEVPGSTEEGGMTYYYLASDVDLNDYDITITGNVALCLNGNVLWGAGNSTVITVSESANFTLHDCKYENIDYPHAYYKDTTDNIWVFGYSDNAEWLAEYESADESNKGTVYGGVITGGYASSNGGGVYVNENGTFTMESGTIAGNTATSYGGGVYVAATSQESYIFIMNNGAIKGNCASTGGAIGGYGLSASYPITINNGYITDNTGGAIGGFYALNLVINNGTITNNSNITAVSTYGSTYVYGGYIDGAINLYYGSSYIRGGYFPSSRSVDDGYTIVNLKDLGGKIYDKNYLSDFPYAVYKTGDATSFFDETGIETIAEDITTCVGMSYNIQFNVTSYSDVSYLAEEATFKAFPTNVGIYEITATLSDVLVEIEGVKTYYDTLTTTFNITIGEHVSGNVKQENITPATCTSEGSCDEVICCLVCGKVVTSTPTTIEALGHNALYFKGQSATTTDTGLLEHWYCLVCNTYFLDEECTEEVEYEELIIPMLEDTGSEGLSGGAIAGIVIASVVVVGLGVVLVILLIRMKKKVE